MLNVSDEFRDQIWWACSAVSLWPRWKRNALQCQADLIPRPVAVLDGVYNDVVPTEPGHYWLQNRRDPKKQVIQHIYPELGLDWTHYWMCGPKVERPV